MIKPPKGLLVFDTCCFLDYLKGNNKGFDYDRIKAFVNANDYWVVISPYTLYELIQKVNSVIQLEERRNELLLNGDFWVLNMNGVLDHDGLEYGMDYIFKLKMHRNDKLLEYDEERGKLRHDVYHSLFKKMFFFSQLVAICCVAFDQSDSSGRVNPEATLQIQLIDHFFDERRSWFEWTFDRFYAQSDGKDYWGDDGLSHKGHDAKELLHKQIWDLVLQILAVTGVRRKIITTKEIVDGNELNRRIVEAYYNLKAWYEANSIHKLYKSCLQRTHGNVCIRSIVSFAFNKHNNDLVMASYQLLLDMMFSPNGVGKDFSNSFIDMTNIALANFKTHTIVLTNDKVWKDLLLNSNYSGKQEHQIFYSDYSID